MNEARRNFKNHVSKVGIKGTKTLNITGQKGGIAKSALNANLAAAIALNGKKVLIIDNDMQGSITSIFTGEVTPVNKSLNLYEEKLTKSEIEKIISKTKIDNVDVISGGYFKSFEIDFGKIAAFKTNIEIIKNKLKYDLILFDFGAKQEAINVITNMLVDSIIIISNTSSFKETFNFLEDLKSLEDHRKEKVVKGILLNNIDIKRDASDREFFKHIKKEANSLVMETIIPTSKVFKKSTLLRKWVIQDTRTNNLEEGNPIANLVIELVRKEII